MSMSNEGLSVCSCHNMQWDECPDAEDAFHPPLKPKNAQHAESVDFALDCINHVIEEYRDDPGGWFPDCACLSAEDTSREILERLRRLRGQFYRHPNAD